MNNLFSYLKWRGDLTFSHSPFNEIDNAILCAFSYIRIEDFIREKDIFSIQELYPMYQNSDKKESILLKNQETLFFLLSESMRFQNIKIAKLVKESSESSEKQFCAMTFILNEEELFIAFRGTDSTLTGWKENFNLSFLDEVPSQKRAVEYLEDIASLTKKNLIVGGHSKGGNLAMYSYVFCKKEVRKRIKTVYNNDGPGLTKKILEDENLKELEEKITTFLPKSSIIGNLFENDSEIKIIKSNSIGILEHDLYTWKVEGNHFVYAKELDKKTKDLCVFLNEKINEIPNAKKKRIIDFIYDLLEYSGVGDIEEMVQNIGKKHSLLKKYNISLEDMQFVWKILPILVEIFKKL